MPAEPSPEHARTGLDTEEALNAPSRLSVRLLGIICAATLIPWAGAKVACNRREAPVREPLALGAEVFAKQPKSAALEFSQRAASNQFDRARELAKGAAADELAAAEARCQAEPKPCEERRAKAEEILTRAVLVRRGPLVAEARTESRIGERVELYSLRLESEGGRWYVVSRAPFEGPLTEPLPVPAGGGGTSSHALPHGIHVGAASHGHAPAEAAPVEPAPAPQQSAPTPTQPAKTNLASPAPAAP